MSTLFWLNGPEWLLTIELDESEPVGGPMPEECLAEIRVNESHGLLTAVERRGIGQLMCCEEFCSVTRLLGVTEKVLKFCRILLDKIHQAQRRQIWPRRSLCGLSTPDCKRCW